MEQLVKVRSKGGHRFELRVPSFTAEAGEFVAIVGASGCGKSTLLDMLALVLRPSEVGAFSLHDATRARTYAVHELAERALANVRRSAIGYVLQTGGLLPFLSVRQNILLPCRLNGITGAETHVDALCRRLGIADQMKKKPQHLSGGQRQRVAIARALAHRPPIVLADEPTAAVDKVTAREIRDVFRELTRQMGVTLLMVTHDVSLVKDAADRIFTFDVSRPSAHDTVSVCRRDGAGGRLSGCGPDADGAPTGRAKAGHSRRRRRR